MFTPRPIPTLDCHAHLDRHSGMQDLLELSRAAGIERLNIVCIPGSPERSLNSTACAMLTKFRHPETVYVFGGLVYNIDGAPTPDDLLRQAELLHEAGCDGIKMLESKPATRKRIPWRTDDPLYDKFFGFLQEQSIPIVWHVADPDSFWDPALISPAARQQGWDYTDGTFPSREQLYGEIDNVLTKFPRLRVIFAHFYFMSKDRERAARFLDHWPNVSFDLTPGAEMYRVFSDDPEGWHDFFTYYQDRIIFGTDNHTPREPWLQVRNGMIDKVRMIRQFLETTGRFEGFGTATRSHVMGIGLGPDALAKIYSRNFERICGVAPRPLNIEAAVKHCDRILSYARRTPGQEPLLQEMQEIVQALRGNAL